MNVLLINPKRNKLDKLRNYFRAHYPEINLIECHLPRHIKDKCFSKTSMVGQYIVNFFYLVFQSEKIKKDNIDFVILYGALAALPYLALVKIFPFLKPKKNILALFWYLQKLKNNKLIHQILKVFFNNEKLILHVHSKWETEFYVDTAGKNILYYPYCLGDVPFDPECGKDKKYIFTGGFTNRDYACLFEAVKDIDHNFIVICSRLNQIPTPPLNVKLLMDVPDKVFNGYMKNAVAVIVPLKDESGASGQMLALAAMALKRPIIYSEAKCLEDYLKPDVTGLAYERGNTNQLRDQITYFLANPEKAHKMAENGFTEYQNCFAKENFYKFIGSLII